MRVELGAAGGGFREGREPGQREASEHRLYALEARLLGPAGLLLLQLLNTLQPRESESDWRTLSERERAQVPTV